MTEDASLRAAVRSFAIEGNLRSIRSHHRGHIHDTLISTWDQGGRDVLYLHQRLNDHVFRDLSALMHNVQVVTEHLRQKIDPERGLTTLELVPTRTGEAYVQTESGSYRTYVFIEDTETFDLCDRPTQAFEAAQAFGSFQAQLVDLDPRLLTVTIPSFFSSPHRLAAFDAVLAADPMGRAAAASDEIRFVQERRALMGVIDSDLAAGRFPERVIHGDTKLNNVLFDLRTGRARCIVDLDTCMSGWSLYDFGDLVRFSAATAEEDATDLERVGIDLELYSAIVHGYLESTASFLTQREVELMPLAARLVTLTVGVRFLTDHLAGDGYFKIHHPGHNLERARVQMRMVEAMERSDDRMRVALRKD